METQTYLFQQSTIDVEIVVLVVVVAAAAAAVVAAAMSKVPTKAPGETSLSHRPTSFRSCLPLDSPCWELPG